MRQHTIPSLGFTGHGYRPLERVFKSDSKQSVAFRSRECPGKIWLFLSKLVLLNQMEGIPGLVQRDSFLILGGVW
jgi:hypothetical protein